MAHPVLTALETGQDILFSAARQAGKPDSRKIHISEANGRIIAEDVISSYDLPPGPTSAVDGFAISAKRHADNPDTKFRIIGTARAGHPFTGIINEDEAVRIYTGAIMPEGPDCVQMHEDCQHDGEMVSSALLLSAQTNIRPQGENLARGELLVAKGQRLSATAIGQLSAGGVSDISCYQPLRATILSMGDEIIPAGSGGLAAGQIFDSNRPMLSSLVGQTGAKQIDGGIVGDSKDKLVAAYKQALNDSDIVISSAGASDGVEDHTQAALAEIGADVLFWRLAIKPGRPVCVARYGDKFIFCLPGNPVAVFVCFMLLVRPAMDILAGGEARALLKLPVKASFSYKKRKGRTEFLRGRLEIGADGQPELHIHGRKGAGVISSLLGADGLIEIPREAEHIEAGEMLNFIPFAEGGL